MTECKYNRCTSLNGGLVLCHEYPECREPDRSSERDDWDKEIEQIEIDSTAALAEIRRQQEKWARNARILNIGISCYIQKATDAMDAVKEIYETLTNLEGDQIYGYKIPYDAYKRLMEISK